MDGMTDLEAMEAIGYPKALALAADLFLFKFRVTCGSSNVIGSIRGEGLGLYGDIIKEIKARMGDFSMCEFIHDGRASNVDVHNLARRCIHSSVGRHVWFLSTPDGVCITNSE